MARVYISVGSNIDRNKYITAGIQALGSIYSPVQCSTIYESESVGFEGANFYNLVVAFDTSDDVATVSANLNSIEDNNDRKRDGPKFSSRTLDLDLLLYDERILNTKELTLPRPEIYENAFVLLPLSELAATQTDPLTGKTYVTLWDEFDKQKQRLWPIDLTL